MQKELIITENAPASLYPSRSGSTFLEDYLWKNKNNRTWWIIGFVIFLIEFALFKLRYSFANYMPDSYSYLEAAFNNVDVNMWPVAYSKFLRLISAFTHSDTILVGLQYFFLQGSTLLFLFSLLYFLKHSRWIKIVLLSFTLLNPLPLYIANYISADALFIGLSLLWLTTLIWLIFRARLWMLLAHAFLLLACFTVRYNAIYYPIISLLVFLLIRFSWKWKITGFVLSIGLLLFSFFYTSQKMQEITGKWQFSSFGGWQLANNALYMYEHIPAAERGPIPPRFVKLETMVREHMDTLKKVKLTFNDSLGSFFYLWNSKGPLIQYLIREYKKDSAAPYFKRWASEGPLYADYGSWLTRKFPSQFAEYWILPNAIKYIVPPEEFLGIYNMGGDSVGKLAQDWFKYKSLKVQDHKKSNPRVVATGWYSIFSAVINIVFILGLISMLLLNVVRWKDYGLPQLMGLILLFWLINGAFSIFASPVVLRYQYFPLLLFFPMSAIFMEHIIKMAFARPIPPPTQLFDHEKPPSVNQQNLPSTS